MNESAYYALFKSLGFSSTTKRKLLRHPKGLPSIYFNVSRDGLVYFAVRAAHQRAFLPNLWTELEPQQKKDASPNLVTLVPKEGRERDAFAGIIAWNEASG